MAEEPQTPEPDPPPANGERLKVPWLSRILIVLASVLAFTGLASAWLNRQVLNTDDWTRTSSQLLADKDVQNTLSTFLVDTLYSSVDVKTEIQQALPPQLKGLAGPAAGGLREFADRAAHRALTTPAVQDKWEMANRIAHERFVNVLEGGNGNLSTQNGVVTLDVTGLITDLSTRLGIGANLASKIPPDAGQIEIVRSNELETAQNATSFLKTIALVLSIFVPLLYAFAVWRAGPGRRRRALLGVGVGLTLAALLLLVARRVGGGVVVDQLADTESLRATVDSVYQIGTSLLREIALTALLFGLFMIVGAWLAGPARPAVAFRRAVAPILRERPAVAYGVVLVLALLFLLFGPSNVVGRLIPVMILVVLAVLSVFFLRRQAEEEFPEATLEDARRRRAERLARWRASWAARRSGRGAAAPADAESGEGRVADLERLADLRSRGVLTDEEFASEKRALLAAGGPAGTP